MEKETTKHSILFYLMSDSIGTLTKEFMEKISNQFPNTDINIELFPFVQSQESLKGKLEKAKHHNAHIIASFVKNDLHQIASDYCESNDVYYFNLMSPIITLISEATSDKPTQQPGNRAHLDDTYYKRIEAVEFTVTNDDGKFPNRLEEADIVLLGISRTSKTPLSVLLSYQGYKVANLPLVPEVQLPKELFTINQNKIIGLTNDINVLNKFRKRRLEKMGAPETGIYSDPERIEKELKYSQKIYNELKCPVINVAERSIEETATLILLLLQDYLKNKEIRP